MSLFKSFKCQIQIAETRIGLTVNPDSVLK